MFNIRELEAAINAARRAESAPEHCLPADASCLATIYGEMIYSRETSRDLATLTETQRATFERWRSK